jgi:hypothetical protein
MKIYQNGEVVGTNTVSFTPATADPNGAIGAGRQGGYNHMDGTVDDVRVYDNALTNTQITRLYNATRPSPINTSRTDRLTSGLVGFWSFNGQDVDLSDSTAEVKDVSGNGNDGDAMNGASPAIGKLGQGYGFDGADDYVDVGDASTYDFGANESFTVSTWFKTSTGDKNQGIVAKIDVATDDTGWAITWPSYNNFKFAVADGSDAASVFAGNQADGQWHHAVMVVDRSNEQLEAFIDSVSKGTSDTSAVGDVSVNRSLVVGNSDAEDENRVLRGKVDNVRIYDRVLSESEVKQLYRLGE